MRHILPSTAVRWFTLGAVGLTVLVGAFTIATSPALSHSTSSSVPGGYGGVQNSHTSVYACDTSANGWGVRTYYRLRSGSNSHVGDANGSAAGCGSRAVTTTSNPVVSYQVCTGPDGFNSVCAFPKTA